MDTFGIIVCICLAVAAYILSSFQFREKWILLNNAWLYASAEERSTMDKKPYYRQSCIVFALIGIIFTLNAAWIITDFKYMLYFFIAIVAIMVIYAVVSTIRIEMKK